MRRSLARGMAVIAMGAAFGIAGAASAQSPKANGETLTIRHANGSTGNMHAFVAARKGFCKKYNFQCQLVAINNALTSVQAMVGGSLDVAQGGIEMTASAINAGADVVIVGLATRGAVLSLAARSDVPLPHRQQGYPAVIADLKGNKIGVPARGAAGEVYLDVMLREAGLAPGDVTVVGTGGPDTAYRSMVVGKQVDAVIAVSPVKELCAATRACSTIVDMTKGEGPGLFRKDSASGVVFVTQRAFAEGNPHLMAAFYAAMKDAADWFYDPANLDELVALYKPAISLGDAANADTLLRNWIRDAIGTYSPDLAVSREGVKAAIDFAVENKMVERPVDVSRIVWDKAP